MSSCTTADCRAAHARVTEIHGASAMNPHVFENGRGVTILLRPTDREYSRLEIIEGLVGTVTCTLFPHTRLSSSG